MTTVGHYPVRAAGGIVRPWTVSNLKYISPYRAVNTLRLGYKNQSVNVVYGNNGCLF